MDQSPSARKLARASLSLAIIGWGIYILQWCYDLSIGLVVAVVTAGTGALCGTALDFIPFLLWIIGIVSGHAALARIKKDGVSGCNAAVWGLVLNYLGLLFSIIFLLLIVVLVASGVETGWFDKIIPSFHK